MSYRTIEQVMSVVVKFVTPKNLEKIAVQLKGLTPARKSYWPGSEDWNKKLEYSFEQIKSVVGQYTAYLTVIVEQLIWLEYPKTLEGENQAKALIDLGLLQKRWREIEAQAQKELAQAETQRLEDQAAIDALKKKRREAEAQAQAQIKASGPIKTKSDIIEELEKSWSKMTAEYKKLGKKLKKLEITIKIAKLEKELESLDSDSDEEILTCKAKPEKKPTGPKVRLPNLMSDYSDSDSESAPEIDSDDE